MFISSQLSTIFTSQISFTGDRKIFGNEKIFECHVKELKSLFEEGLTIKLKNNILKKKKIIS